MIAVTMVGKQPQSVRETKLISDVASINQSIALYLADGGDLKTVTSPQAVLDRLKRARPQADWQRHTGASSGRMVDTRLRARMTTTPPQGGGQRARWNVQTQRFELTLSSGSAVTEFFLDEELTASDPGTDTTRKTSVVRYNGTRGWIWQPSQSSALTYNQAGNTNGTGVNSAFDPDEAAPTTSDSGPDPGGDPGGGSGTGGGTTDPGGPTPPSRLPRPAITPSGGTYAYASFPTTATISNAGAPGGTDSVLQYRKNGGPWTAYDGSPVELLPSDLIEARNLALNTTVYSTSTTAQAKFYRLVSNFSGTSSGTWGNATGGANLLVEVLNGPETSTFKHGNTRLDLGNGEFLDAGTENVLSFTRVPFDTIVPNTWFTLGDMMMLNGTTFYDSEATSVTLSVNISINEPPVNTVVHINLGLISTENTSDRLASADIVQLLNPSTDFTVTIDGVTYRLELSWATLDPGAGVVQGNQFLIYEGSTAQAQLRARFKSNL
ncbi:MAG: choice-of-anchor K domain-containing protein [Prosthecobacter sp.]|nr:choice-of-anchor K domain-containing protein [Prosthecobacter sp.]